MKNYGYKKRTDKQLHDALRHTLNTLCMRDWEVDLVIGGVPPKELSNQWENAASVSYNVATLKAVIYINIPKCAEDNQDPLCNLYHEIFHIWLNYCDDEERQCNILANILMGSKHIS